MIEIKIPKEVTEYKEKVALGFTFRQVVSLGISSALGYGIYALLKDTYTIDTITTIMLVIAVPILSIGFIDFKNISLEIFLKYLTRFYFLPQNRKYYEFDYMTYICDLAINEEISEELTKNAKSKKRFKIEEFREKTVTNFKINFKKRKRK